MQFELVKCVTQVALVEGERAVQEFVAAGLDPAFHDRVHARYPDAGAHDLDAGVAQDFVEEGGVLRVPVPDAAGGVLDDREDVLALAGQSHCLDEVAGHQGVGLGA
ncbi:hypothetical protein [Streptomyces sp. NPDC054866]